MVESLWLWFRLPSLRAHDALKGRPRKMRTVNLVWVTQGLLGTFFKRT